MNKEMGGASEGTVKENAGCSTHPAKNHSDLGEGGLYE